MHVQQFAQQAAIRIGSSSNKLSVTFLHTTAKCDFGRQATGSHAPLGLRLSAASFHTEWSLLNKVSNMAFYMHQRNSCVEILCQFQTGTESSFWFNLEIFTYFRQNTYSSDLIYVLKIITTYTAFMLF